MSKETKDISIVIATLGGLSLSKIIDCVCKQSVCVKEIIICLPNDSKFSVDFKKQNNIILCISNKRGQVSQRSEGLKIATGKFIIQLDDDMYFSESFIESFYNHFIKIKYKAALAPLFKDIKSKNYLTNYNNSIINILKSIIIFLLSGAPFGYRKMGSIDRGGIPYGVDKNYLSNSNPVEVKWLPGGCVICHRDNLIYDDYYPFEGKAYSEDLIHSLLWQEKGVKLFVDPSIYIYTEIKTEKRDFNSYYLEYKARNYYLKLCKKSYFTSLIYFIITLSRYFINIFFKKINK